MRRLVKEMRFQLARIILSAYVALKYLEVLELGIKVQFKPTGAANSLEELGAQFKAGSVTISTLNCGNTIYLSERINCYARLWHDYIHFKVSKDFSYSHEIDVGHRQLNVANTDGLPELVQKLLWLDTVGQTKYHFNCGRFPRNQYEWMRQRLKMEGLL